jgi:pilus assembly protein CpaE
MYPLNALLIGCTDSVLSQLRPELANLSVTIESEHLDVRACLSYVLAGPPGKRLFVIQPKSATEISQLERLNESVVGQPILALVDPAGDPSIMVRAMRAGAAQVVRLPLQADDFRAAMQRIAIQFGYPASPCRTITVLGASEGSGATTIALNLASEIGRLRNALCILAEGNVAFGRLAHYLAIEPHETLYDLFSDIERVDVERLRRALTKVEDNLEVVTGSYRAITPLAFTHEQALGLLTLAKQLADTVVVDGRYNYEDLDFEFVSKVDQLVLVSKPTIMSLYSLRMMLDQLEERQCMAEQFIVINHFDRRAQDISIRRIQEVLRAPKIFTVAADAAAYTLAETAGQTLRRAAAHSRACKDITKLAKAMLGMADVPSRAGRSLLEKLSRLAHPFGAK